MGIYESINKAKLASSPWYQALDAETKLAFLALLIEEHCGVSGIMNMDAHILSSRRRTSLPEAKCATALERLDKEGRIVRDGDTVWLVSGPAYRVCSPTSVRSFINDVENRATPKIKAAVWKHYRVDRDTQGHPAALVALHPPDGPEEAIWPRHASPKPPAPRRGHAKQDQLDPEKAEMRRKRLEEMKQPYEQGPEGQKKE